MIAEMTKGERGSQAAFAVFPKPSLALIRKHCREEMRGFFPTCSRGLWLVLPPLDSVAVYRHILIFACDKIKVGFLVFLERDRSLNSFFL